jgi:methionine-rich copper-binding protein CopC
VATSAAALAIAGGAVLGLAGPAQAHNYLIASTPEVGGTLTALPKAFEITR